MRCNLKQEKNCCLIKILLFLFSEWTCSILLFYWFILLTFIKLNISYFNFSWEIYLFKKIVVDKSVIVKKKYFQLKRMLVLWLKSALLRNHGNDFRKSSISTKRLIIIFARYIIIQKLFKISQTTYRKIASHKFLFSSVKL